jgi:hypothetical protein
VLRFVLVLLACLGFTTALTTALAASRRLAVATFLLLPDGQITITTENPSGERAQPLNDLRLQALAERGASVRAELTRKRDSLYVGTLALAPGETWNLSFEATMPAVAAAAPVLVRGSYLVAPNEAEMRGRVALVPPNPATERFSLWVPLMFGIPLALALLATVWGVLQQRRVAAKAV